MWCLPQLLHKQFITIIIIVTHFSICQAIDCSKSSNCQCTANEPCVMNCNAGVGWCQDINLYCKSGQPCTIYCTTSSSCKQSRFHSNGATSLTVYCRSIDACQGSGTHINCEGDRPCSIYCDGSGACGDTNINTQGASSLDVSCLSSDSCSGSTQIKCKSDAKCDINCNNCNRDVNINENGASEFKCSGDCPPSAAAPYKSPTRSPSYSPSISPTKFPSVTPTDTPTMTPTHFPTNSPSQEPTSNPSMEPTIEPTGIPTDVPSVMPTFIPTMNPVNSSSLSTSDPAQPPVLSIRLTVSTPTMTFVSDPQLTRDIVDLEEPTAVVLDVKYSEIQINSNMMIYGGAGCFGILCGFIVILLRCKHKDPISRQVKDDSVNRGGNDMDMNEKDLRRMSKHKPMIYDKFNENLVNNIAADKVVMEDIIHHMVTMGNDDSDDEMEEVHRSKVRSSDDLYLKPNKTLEGGQEKEECQDILDVLDFYEEVGLELQELDDIANDITIDEEYHDEDDDDIVVEDLTMIFTPDGQRRNPLNWNSNVGNVGDEILTDTDGEYEEGTHANRIYQDDDAFSDDLQNGTQTSGRYADYAE